MAPLAIAVLLSLLSPAVLALPAELAPPAATLPWWGWSFGVFLVSVLIGLVAVPAGVGGGVLFVPIVGGFFPFHLDFVRGAGLLVALTSALVSGPALLRQGLASLRLALPLALAVSIGSIAGARTGLRLPESLAQTLLGLVILGITLLMWRVDPAGRIAPEADPLAGVLGIGGRGHDPAASTADWSAARLVPGWLIFLGIGFVAGVFGLGAGWANVPVLSLLMGLPLKVAAGTSGLVLSMTSPAALVYLGHGAMLPAVAVPAVLGVTVGAAAGVRLLQRLPARTLRRLVLGVLLLAGLRALVRGLT
ncbi:MAG: sulfite exporter TauE/SafE family protein [Betaproteobacteria bacterium]|nr:sulfite exporter TauE/SafE family protein [Betaproteobacteria bacterium]